MEARVITLNPESERLGILCKRLLGLAGGAFASVAPFPATDGRGKTAKAVATDRTGPGFPLIPVASLAIADSHMRAWEAAFDGTNASRAAFFEDDAMVRRADEAGFAERLAGALEESASSADVLMLGCFSSPAMSFLVALSGCARPAWAPRGEAGEYTDAPGVATGFHAYVLSRSGYYAAREKVYGRVVSYLDYEMQKLAAMGDVRLRAARPLLVHQTSTATATERAAESTAAAAREDPQGAAAAFAGGSSSSRSSFPALVSHCLDDLPLGDHVSARYVTNVELFTIFGVAFTPMYIALAAVGFLYTLLFILLAAGRLSDSPRAARALAVKVLAGLYAALALPDVIVYRRWREFLLGGAALLVIPLCVFFASPAQR